eukprot:311759-Amphidinium_carterae.1
MIVRISTMRNQREVNTMRNQRKVRSDYDSQSCQSNSMTNETMTSCESNTVATQQHQQLYQQQQQQQTAATTVLVDSTNQEVQIQSLSVRNAPKIDIVAEQ